MDQRHLEEEFYVGISKKER